MKKIYIDKRALGELKEFSENVQIEFNAYLTILKQKGRLEFPESKKIDKNLFEIRIKLSGEYRGLYGYIAREYIIILLFFQKKTQKTPLKFIKTARKRLEQYE